jgi:hypothetical protein
MFTNKTYIKATDIKLLAEKIYDENGRGITLEDIITEFEVKKRKAQRTLKHFHTRKELLTAYDLEKEGFHIKGIKRERPQRYFSIGSKTKLIERLKNNVPKDTTEYRQDLLGPLKAYNFEQILKLLSYAILFIHKLQIQTWIDKENYEYLKDIETQDNSKVVIERIGNHTIELRFHPNGSVMIYVSCSYQPFRLYNDQDVSDILIFLGRVEEKLKNVLRDNRDKVTSPVNRWVLKGCDVNKDVELEGAAQVTLPDIQIPFAEMALRAYVKPIGDKVFYRVEHSLTPNMPIREALDSLRREVIIDSNSFKL